MKLPAVVAGGRRVHLHLQITDLVPARDHTESAHLQHVLKVGDLRCECGADPRVQHAVTAPLGVGRRLDGAVYGLRDALAHCFVGQQLRRRCSSGLRAALSPKPGSTA